MYSTILSCRFWVAKARVAADATDAEITEATSKADQKVREDLSKVIDVSLIPDTDPPTCEKYVTYMSEMKAAEFIVVHLHGANRKIDEVSDVQYFMKQYAMKLEKILEGEVDLGSLGLSVGTFTNDTKPDVIPAFGSGFYGEFIDKEGLEAVRKEGTEEGPDRDD